MDEEILIQRVANGDTQAFGTLVKRYQHRLVRFAERMLGDADAAQDIAQETFLRLWRSRSSCPVTHDLNSYLFRVSRNLCIDYFRTHRATEILDEWAELKPSIDDDPAAASQSRELAEEVRCIVSALPDQQREVFVLSHYEDLSYREIATIVGCPIGTVASRKYQAVETLRRRLGRWVDPDGDAN